MNIVRNALFAATALAAGPALAQVPAFASPWYFGVGIGQGPVLVQRGLAHGVADVTLRPLQPTDPPLLTALPFLAV